MAFDGIALHGIINELKDIVCCSRINRIYQNKRNELIFFLRHPEKEYKLLISPDSSNCRIHLTSDVGEKSKKPPMFCMLLRKYLGGGRILSIAQWGLERIVEIHIQNTDEFMQVIEYKLIIEIMGKHSNIILINKDTNKIIDSIKRISFDINRYRQILPGKIYVKPPLEKKMDLLEVDNKNIMSIVYDATLGNEGQTLSRWIMNKFAGFSGAAAQEIAFRAGIPHKKDITTLSHEEVIRVSENMIKLKDELTNCYFHPRIYLDSNTSEPKDFWVYPLNSINKATETLRDGVNETADAYYQSKLDHQKLRQAKHNLSTKLGKSLSKLRQNLHYSNLKLEKSNGMERYKLWGELLSAYLYKVKSGAEKITLPNFYDEDKDITITLNPKLSPAQNAQKFFSRYKKLQSTKTIVKTRMEDTIQEINYLENTLVSIENSEQLEDILEIEQELKAQGYIKIQSEKDHRITSQPLRFSSSDGFSIRVGKNNRQNDLLTKKSKPDDIWLHAKDIPGSHVIIECHGKTVSEKALFEASILAAYFSKSRNSSNVPVDHTHVRNVQKPSGSKPGFVIYFHQKTLFVTPDRQYVEKLSI